MSRCCDGRFLRRAGLALAFACLTLIFAAPDAAAVKHGGHTGGTAQTGPAGPKGGSTSEPPLALPGGEVGTAAKDLGDEGQVDPISGLGIRNPVCDALDQIRDRPTRLSCEASGTPQSNYPASNYGFDIHITTGVTHLVGDAMYGFATILNGIWLGLIFVLHLILALLGLAFGLNPFGNGQTMSQVTGALARVYSRITDPWLSTLVVCGGIWFAYKGLVKREVSAGAAGTIAAVAMLVLGLWVVHQPRQSVGRLASISDEVALGVISAPQTGSVSRPIGSYAEAMSRAWSQLVEVPFAGLDFSDVRWALSAPPPEAVKRADARFCDDVGALAYLALFSAFGDVEAREACAAYARRRYGRPRRVIDLYLRSSPSSPSREALWDYFDGNDEYKDKVAAQGGDGVLTRLSMLAIFAIGLLGALLLLAWLAVRLFTQAAIAFVLLLVAPFALFFPMLGDSGRRAFKTWGLALLGAIVAKVIYAAFLSVVLLGLAILGKVNGPAGSSTGFLLSCVFTWAVFLRRTEVVGWMSIGEGESGHARGLGLGHFEAMRMGRRVAGMPFAAVRGAARRSGHWRRVRRAERGEATRETAGTALKDSARRLGDDRYEQARRTVAAYEGGQSGAAGAGNGASKRNEALSWGAGTKDQARGLVHAPQGSTAESASQPRVPEGSRSSTPAEPPPSPERYQQAKELVARAERNERVGGKRWTDRDLKGFEAENRRLLKGSDDPADHAHRVKDLGRSKFEALQGADREAAVEKIEQARKRDAKRERVSSELPGRVVGRGRQKAEALRQHRESLAGNNARWQHLRQRRRERLARRDLPPRRGLSRGS